MITKERVDHKKGKDGFKISFFHLFCTNKWKMTQFIFFKNHRFSRDILVQNLVHFIKKSFHWKKVDCVFHHKFEFRNIFFDVEDEIGFVFFLLRMLNIGFENFSILCVHCSKLQKILNAYNSRYWPIQVNTCKMPLKIK